MKKLLKKATKAGSIDVVVTGANDDVCLFLVESKGFHRILLLPHTNLPPFYPGTHP